MLNYIIPTLRLEDFLNQSPYPILQQLNLKFSDYKYHNGAEET